MANRRRLWLWYLAGAPALGILGFVAWLSWPLTGRLEAVPATGGTEAAGQNAAGAGALREVQRAAVGVAAAERRSLSVLAEATGRLEPWRQAELSVEVGGRVLARKVEPGQRVAAGGELLQLEPIDRQLELAEATADLLRVQAQYALMVASDRKKGEGAAEAPIAALEGESFAEAQARYDQGLIPRAELDRLRRRSEASSLLRGERQDEVRAVNIGLLQAEQRLEKAQLQLRRTRLEAPFAGRVADLAVEVGQQVSPGQVCLKLLDDSRLTVAVDVLERDLLRIKVGARASVRIPALDNRSFGGRVHSINPRVDPASGTGRVQVVVDNPEGELLPGVFAFVKLETGQRPEQTVVPAAAILMRQGRELVFRVDDGRALWSWVKTGARTDQWVEVLEGVEEGQKVAVSGHFALAHEAPVNVADVPAALPQTTPPATESRAGPGAASR